MSVQFGRWNFAGEPLTPNYLEKVRATLIEFGPDGGNCYSCGANILYRAFHTTQESRCETQPFVLPSGAVLTWDGRLDNRTELLSLMGEGVSNLSADVSIVAAAYRRWNIHCFAKLIGDWALSIWDPNERSVILAKDPIGTRHLYYSVAKDHLAWSTILDPLVLFSGASFALNEEYIAGWFSSFPVAHLTPYLGIHSVPPSCFVRVGEGRSLIQEYWDFDPEKRTRYRTDGEYEEHFRTVFMQAVRRCLRSDAPILAELSGGMDSSSIVCMADTIIAQAATDIPRLDTLSYYNDSEPNWNERPYFAKVEEKRGRAGCHVDVAGQEFFTVQLGSDAFAATPGSVRGRPTEASRQLSRCLASQGNRVVLSGIGGDEVMGGVPTPAPELMDLLATARLRVLASQLKAWALNKRKPWFHLLLGAARGFCPPGLVGIPKHTQPPPWLDPDFIKRHRATLAGYPSRVKFFGPLPSFQENVSTLDVMRRQLTCSALSPNPLFERRYPYLDRDLLEFMYAIPREQVLRPGRRRSLMRRALVGIVPDELLNRRRKAFVVRSPMAAISTQWENLAHISQHMHSASLGIVDAPAFCEALDEARRGQEIPMNVLLRTLGIEVWLKTLPRHQRYLNSHASTTLKNDSTVDAQQLLILRPFNQKHSTRYRSRRISTMKRGK